MLVLPASSTWPRILIGSTLPTPFLELVPTDMNVRSTLSRLPLLLALVILPAPALGQAAAVTEPAIGERVPVQGGAYWNITVPQLREMLADKDFPLVNVHIPFQGDLPDTDLSIPFDQIAEQLDRLPADRDAPVVLYCRSGGMSRQSSTVLAELGYTRIYNLVGGFRAWGEAGLPLINP